MIRIETDLRTIGRNIQADQRDFSQIATIYQGDLDALFSGIVLYNFLKEKAPVFGVIKGASYENQLTEEILSEEKPFILTSAGPDNIARVFFGVNIKRTGDPSFSIIGEVKTTYLWGIGPDPILPPMTELLVYDRSGGNIMTSGNVPQGDYNDLDKQYTSRDPRVFKYNSNGEIFVASISNLFVESRFQHTGWLIIVSQSLENIMVSIDNFKKTFPFVILLFLLLILYLSVMFIRKGLEPLEKLKEGTRRIARKDFSATVEINSDDEFGELGKSFNEMSSKLDKQIHALTVLGEIDRAILSSVDRTTILETTLRRLKDFFVSDIALCIEKIASAENHVQIHVMEGRREKDFRVEYSNIHYVEETDLFAKYDHVISGDQDSTVDFLESIAGERCADYLCLPLKSDGKINSALILGWKKEHTFQEDELNQARQIGDQLAIALANSKLLEDMENLARGTIEALARAVDAKSKWTSGHSERVAKLCCRIAEVLGVSDVEIETISRGGLLHDIGKIGISVAILDKPGKLTEEEFAEIKNHPSIGGQILEPIKAYQDILPMVEQHHEKYDGTGYPSGLKGDEIDIRARIMAVADIWDALVSDRPYRNGWVYDRAKKLITDGSGTHFDPKVVDAFLAVIATG